MEDLASTVSTHLLQRRLLSDKPYLVHSERRHRSRGVACSSPLKSEHPHRRLPTRLRAVSGLFEIEAGILTILNPGVSQGMNSLRLMLPNDHIPDCATREQVEHCICICSFSLLVAAPLDTLISLHLTVVDLSWLDVHCLVEYNCFFGYREFQNWKWESWERSTSKVSLSRIDTTLRAVTLLSPHCCCRA